MFLVVEDEDEDVFDDDDDDDDGGDMGEGEKDGIGAACEACWEKIMWPPIIDATTPPRAIIKPALRRKALIF